MSIAESTKSTWMDVTNESVHTSDDVDIGDIEAINRDFIVVKRGIIHVHYYYIPITKVEGWDGHVVWLKIPYEEVQQKYHSHKPPDPSRFYVKGYPYDKLSPYATDYFPRMPIIKASKVPANRTSGRNFSQKLREHTRVLCATASSVQRKSSARTLHQIINSIFPTLPGLLNKY